MLSFVGELIETYNCVIPFDVNVLFFNLSPLSAIVDVCACVCVSACVRACKQTISSYCH